jgi:hypothetical protein
LRAGGDPLTLSVTVHRRDPATGALLDEPTDEPGATLAGLEAWRTSVYGSSAVQRRGARFLPKLAHTDLLIEGHDLAEFIAECATLLNDVDALALETQVGVETLRSRIENLLRAAKTAQAIAGLLWIS